MSITYLNSKRSKSQFGKTIPQRSNSSRVQNKLAFGFNLDFLQNSIIWQITGFVILTISFFYLVQTINSNSSIDSQAANSDSARIITNFNLQANFKNQSKVEIADAK